MKKFYVILAAVAGITLTSCTSNEYLGEVDPTANMGDGSIQFGLSLPGTTRADIYGNAAAKLLGNNFYVTGTKGTEEDDSPTTNLVFDNYLVHYEANTAGTQEDNTANWEYVGVTPGTAPTASYPKLGAYLTGTGNSGQTIKYWDYSAAQYDFFAFSTGTYTPVAVTPTDPFPGYDDPSWGSTAENIGVTASKYGADLANSGVAYTFYIPSVNALKQAYVTDITEVPKENYGQDVMLKFKNLGSKVRIALYETVPGYSVKNVVFYQWDDATDITANGTTKIKGTTAALISANSNGLPTNGTIQVIFPHVGTNYEPGATNEKEDYDKVAGHVTPVALADGGKYTKYQGFGTLSNFAAKEFNEVADSYLGRTLTAATFAGSSDAAYYEEVFPVSSSDPLTLRVDYTLVSVDGSGETINVYGAKAVVPSTYINWLPNYAYTYIFKISDNTNGWTSTATTTDLPGLYPITFDAVVTEATNATDQQTTITTVATPSITTYQQGHTYATNEYSKSQTAGKSTDVKKLYVQVMDNSTATATLVTTLSNTNSLLYAVSDADATEAEVMDALENRTTAIGADNVTGRNEITLTKNTNIANNVTSIVNGVDDNPITVASGSAAQIAIASLSTGTYAYVYDYTSGSKTTVDEYQQIVPAGASIYGSNKYYIDITTLNGISVTTAEDNVDDDCIYFSKTKNGTDTWTYSYISTVGKTKVPAGVVKVEKSSLSNVSTDSESPTTTANRLFFTSYISNNGSYAVKVIKVVS